MYLYLIFLFYKLKIFSLDNEYVEEEENDEVENEIENEYPCDKCNEMFLIKSNLLQHLRDEHSKMENSIVRPFSCKLCNYRFKRKDHLSRHILKIHKQRMIKESEHENHLAEPKTSLLNVNLDPNSKKLWLINQSKKPETKNSKKHTCHICSKVFTRKDNLKTHIFRMHPSKRQQIVINVKKHPVSRDWICPLCFKSFLNKHHLARHKTNVHKL